MDFKNILVIGSHGKVGKLIVKYLEESGYKVYAMIRDDTQKDEMEKMGAGVVIADLEEDFSYIYKNIDAIIFTAGSGSQTGPEKTISVDQDGAIRSIELAERFFVKRYILVSAQGAREPEEPSKIQHYYKAKAIADNRLINSDLQYTIFRPGRLLDGKGSGKVDISGGNLERSSTSRDNLARAINCSVNNRNTYKKVLEIIEGNVLIEEALSNL